MAGSGSASGCTCVCPQLQVAIMASRARPVLLARRDPPSLPRPAEGPHWAAHLCAPIRESRSRCVGYTPCHSHDTTLPPGLDRQRVSIGRHMYVPPAGSRYLGAAGTPHAARATQPLPSRPRPGAGPHLAAHICAPRCELRSWRAKHVPRRSRDATLPPGLGRQRVLIGRHIYVPRLRVAFAARRASPSPRAHRDHSPSGPGRERVRIWPHMSVQLRVAIAASRARPGRSRDATLPPCLDRQRVRNGRHMHVPPSASRNRGAAGPSCAARSTRPFPSRPRPGAGPHLVAHVRAPSCESRSLRVNESRAARATRPSLPASTGRGSSSGGTLCASSGESRSRPGGQVPCRSRIATLPLPAPAGSWSASGRT
jgi:hypothetical protein